MAKAVKLTSSWIQYDSGVALVSKAVDTGNVTYTESHHGEFVIATNTSVTAGKGQLAEGNFLWLKNTTGTLWVHCGTQAISSLNSIPLKSSGYLHVALGTLTGLKLKNTNTTSQTTVEFWMTGD